MYFPKSSHCGKIGAFEPILSCPACAQYPAIDKAIINPAIKQNIAKMKYPRLKVFVIKETIKGRKKNNIAINAKRLPNISFLSQSVSFLKKLNARSILKSIKCLINLKLYY